MDRSVNANGHHLHRHRASSIEQAHAPSGVAVRSSYLRLLPRSVRPAASATGSKGHGSFHRERAARQRQIIRNQWQRGLSRIGVEQIAHGGGEGPSTRHLIPQRAVGTECEIDGLVVGDGGARITRKTFSPAHPVELRRERLSRRQVPLRTQEQVIVGGVTCISPCQVIDGPLMRVVAGELQRSGRIEAHLELAATTRLPAAVGKQRFIGRKEQRIADAVLEQGQSDLPRQRRPPEKAQLGGANPFRFQWRGRLTVVQSGESVEPRSPERLAVKQFGGQVVGRFPDQADARIGRVAVNASEPYSAEPGPRMTSMRWMFSSGNPFHPQN